MTTELEGFKYQVENGESIVYALEQIDMDKLYEEDFETAAKVEQAMSLIDEITEAANIEY